MAKVDGPLFSLEARGKIADAVVFFPWKGRHIVRQWLKPTNTKSTLQGYVRAAMKTISKFISKIGNTNDGDSLDSKIYQALTSSVSAGLNWNAWCAEGLMDALQDANTFKTTDFTNLVEEYSSSLAESVQTSFAAAASALGLEDFTFGYGYTTSIPAGLQLYFGANALYNLGIIGSAPYNTAPVSWDTGDVGDLAEEMTTDA